MSKVTESDVLNEAESMGMSIMRSPNYVLLKDGSPIHVAESGEEILSFIAGIMYEFTKNEIADESEDVCPSCAEALENGRQ